MGFVFDEQTFWQFSVLQLAIKDYKNLDLDFLELTFYGLNVQRNSEILQTGNTLLLDVFLTYLLL